MKIAKELTSYVLIGFGLSLLFYLTFVSWQWSFAPQTQASGEGLYLSVLVNSQNKPLRGLFSLRQSRIENNKSPVLGASDKKSGLTPKHFNLSIPSLKIKEAKVVSNVNSDMEEVYFPVLREAIAHYEGTALPEEEGNTFLYGHSVLPAFYNPGDYLTIFSLLPQMRIGDEFSLNYAGKEFSYAVFAKKVVEPNNLHSLEPYPFKTATLMTCFPPGLTTKRLLVVGRLLD